MRLLIFTLILVLLATSVSALDHIGGYYSYPAGAGSYGGSIGCTWCGGYARPAVGGTYGCNQPWASNVRAWTSDPYAGLRLNYGTSFYG